MNDCSTSADDAEGGSLRDHRDRTAQISLAKSFRVGDALIATLRASRTVNLADSKM